MSGDEAEYVVEYIVRAKVVGSKRGKKKWQYLVKWKDYSFEDNTWEPVESFAGGSEHFVESFWDRVDTNGRNYHDLNQFSLDEELFPSGPPRRKKAKKAKEEVRIPSPPVEEILDSENEVRSIINDEEDVQEEASTSRRKRRRSSAASSAIDNPSQLKRKRGRPPGKRPEELEEEEEAVNDEPSPPKRKRGRPPGKRPEEGTTGLGLSLSPLTL
ncbi:hypothetical protein NUW54_g7552 [Trametes sanguinea]|uniref:Uncharacterized protein n=1 Tax=Trametes sanguinea TaxID=158606 RepID=A0ACC1PKU8_9APHY|nr:hypothetical protein NUW54_g7552 [Trametes sanguinea]